MTALDGDKGVPNTVSYSFIQGDEGYFDIEADTGWITVKTQLDRDTSDVTQKGGAFAIYVKVRLTEYLQLQNLDSILQLHTSNYPYTLGHSHKLDISTVSNSYCWRNLGQCRISTMGMY